MSNGVPVPSIWPPANTSSSNQYPTILVDEGSFFFLDGVLGTDSEVIQIVRVENLPDDDTSIGKAVDSAIAAYPSHPNARFAGMVLFGAGPLFGHTHLKGNSMIVDRDITLDAGIAAKVVTLPSTVTDGVTGSTGTCVLVKLSYGWPKKLSGF